jgi:hypothetical protein
MVVAANAAFVSGQLEILEVRRVLLSERSTYLGTPGYTWVHLGVPGQMLQCELGEQVFRLYLHLD